MSTILAVRTNHTGRRTVHRPWWDYDVHAVVPHWRLPTACGWYGEAVYSSLDAVDLAGASRCRRCFPDPMEDRP